MPDRVPFEPVTITKNGHDRRVIPAGELPDAELALIAAAEVRAAYAHLDDELDTVRP